MEQQLRCNLCDKSFNTKHQFTSHQETQHSLQDVPDKVNLTAPPASFPHHRRPSSTLTQQRKIPSVVTHQIASRPTLPKIIAQSNSHTKMASIAKSKTQLISNSKPAFMIQSTSQPISHSVSRSLRHPTPQPATQPTLKLAHQTESRSVPQIVPELILQSSSQRASYNHHNQPKALNTLIPKAVPSQMSTTTLITITTPSAQPSAPPLVHHSAQRNQRAFVSRSSTFQNSYPHIRSPVRNQVEKLEKITCCACNQVFTNTDDLSFHQCVVPVVTITGPKDLANLLTEDKAPDVIDLKDDDDSNDKIMVDLIKPITSVSNTIRPAYKRLATESSGGQRQISNYRDPKCLDMQNRVKRTYSTANRHRVHKKIETSSASPSTQLNVNGSQEQLHRHYQHQHHYRHSQKQSQSQSNSSSSLAARPRQQHYLIETPGHPPQLILADSDAFQMDPEQLQALLHEQQRLQSGNETRSDYATDEPESTITSNSNEELLDCLPPEQVEAAEKLAEQAALEGGQLIMIQHPDGQCVQICVPQGMDIDEVLKSLNQNWPLDQPLSESEELSTANEDNKHNDASRTQSIVTPSLGQPPLINLDETDETDPDSEPISCETEATPQTATELIEQVHLIEDDHSQIYLTEDPQPNEIEMLDSATHHRTSPVTGSELLDTAIAQSFADPGSFDLTSNQPTDLEGLTMDTIDGQTIELDGQQLLTAEQAAQLIQLADQQQITLDPSLLTDAEGQIPDGEQQLIYLPVNEDGTCAIDAASFAMLTCNGEMPIIVSSDNQLPAS